MTHHVQKYGFETELGLTNDPGNEVDFQLATVCHAVFSGSGSFYKDINTFDLFDKFVVPELLYGCEIWF